MHQQTVASQARGTAGSSTSQQAAQPHSRQLNLTAGKYLEQQNTSLMAEATL
jgi:hypothetical protein